ncbi:uncharacterized protein LOC135347397 isoform X2 [Halichondria panicea]|uniref:uncharacterized protein LOC135347397 isoform X2 n=1 Tax=Halichondria panicea TaxID=6063 RepID=UPI00312B8B80
MMLTIILSIVYIMFIDIYGTLIEKFSFCSEVIYSLSRDGSTACPCYYQCRSLFFEGSLFIFPLYFTMYLSLPLRYYVAEDVRLYSQDTWRVVTQTRGVQLVKQYIHKVSQVVNHAVRETACICTAELGTKVNKDCLKPYERRLFHFPAWRNEWLTMPGAVC